MTVGGRKQSKSIACLIQYIRQPPTRMVEVTPAPVQAHFWMGLWSPAFRNGIRIMRSLYPTIWKNQTVK